MHPNLTPLKTYIISQRKNNMADESIAAALTSAGWQTDMVTQAFAEIKSENETTVTSQTMTTGISENQQSKPAEEAVQPEQPQQTATTGQLQQSMVARTDVSDKYKKQVKIIAKIVIALGIVAIIGGIYPEFDSLVLISGIAQVLIGAGLLAFKKIAYTLFNILVILIVVLALVGLTLTLLSPFGMLVFVSIFMMLSYSSDIKIIIDLILTIILGPAQFIFYIYGGILFHKKEVRALFDKKY